MYREKKRVEGRREEIENFEYEVGIENNVLKPVLNIRVSKYKSASGFAQLSTLFAKSKHLSASQS
jgi:hypothetical protein